MHFDTSDCPENAGVGTRKMQQGREGRGDSTRLSSSSPFDSFGGFGAQGSMLSSIFGGRDPFDDPFFTRPLGSVFELSGHTDSFDASRSRQPIIEELSSDDETEIEEEEEEKEATGSKCNSKSQKRNKSSKEPLVEHPDDEDNGEKSKGLRRMINYNRGEGTKPQSQSVSFRKVTYGGINGTYYTATTTRRTGRDGVVLEESKQADITTGQAAHRISKGIHDKGHTVTRKLDANGRVDTMQTLHNLNEDELTSFDQDWNGNVNKNLASWKDDTSASANAGSSGSGSGKRPATSGWALPISKFLGRGGGKMRDSEDRSHSSGGSRPKKVVTVNID